MEHARATDARWLPNYVKAFGIPRGLYLLWRIARLDRADGRKPELVTVPGVGKVWMRAALRDHAIFQQVWVKREYDLRAAAPSHFPALMASYKNTLASGGRPLILDIGAHLGMDRAPLRGVGTALLSRVGCSIRLPGAAG